MAKKSNLNDIEDPKLREQVAQVEALVAVYGRPKIPLKERVYKFFGLIFGQIIYPIFLVLGCITLIYRFFL